MQCYLILLLLWIRWIIGWERTHGHWIGSCWETSWATNRDSRTARGKVIKMWWVSYHIHSTWRGGIFKAYSSHMILNVAVVVSCWRILKLLNFMQQKRTIPTFLNQQKRRNHLQRRRKKSNLNCKRIVIIQLFINAPNRALYE